MIEAAILVLFPFAMVFAAISDLLSMTIANRVSVLLVAGFAIIAPLTGMPWPDVGMHLLTGFVLLLFTFAMFTAGAMGGGDAKLIAATGVWMGAAQILAQYLIVSTLIGGLLTLAILSYRKSPLPAYAGRFEFLRRMGNKDEGIPYGIALGIGGLICYPDSVLMTWALASLSGN
jgi:prepilin peptidase CpaA